MMGWMTSYTVDAWQAAANRTPSQNRASAGTAGISPRPAGLRAPLLAAMSQTSRSAKISSATVPRGRQSRSYRLDALLQPLITA